jgi:gamma-glutamyl hercynylcysteine S-oxide synthase
VSDYSLAVSPANSQTQPLGGVESLLDEVRRRTLSIVAAVFEEDLNRVHNPLMSPLVWDLGHIAAFEDLWLAVRGFGLEPLRPELMRVYDADETPRPERGELPYLRLEDALEYMEDVRARALSVLGRVEPLLHELVIQHECQHNETMLQTLQLAEAGVFVPKRRQRRGSAREGTVSVVAGPFTLGAEGDGFAYDNERPAHVVELPAFEIEAAPVTNAAYAAFVEDGGYSRRELWSGEGWAWRKREGAERPLFWTEAGGERRFDRVEPLRAALPAMHVSWFEADAYARWAGKRLPSEAEWEKAARLDGGERGGLDQVDFGPGPAGPFVGDCWEWTASDFGDYPGFHAHPYREYSEVFFESGYKVLRGGSWATHSRVARETFRNWDHPQRRQIFAGFRCAA